MKDARELVIHGEAHLFMNQDGASLSSLMTDRSVSLWIAGITNVQPTKKNLYVKRKVGEGLNLDQHKIFYSWQCDVFLGGISVETLEGYNN